MAKLVYILGQLFLICSTLSNKFERQTSTGCPIDFIKHENSCYHIFATPTLKWWEAMAYCEIYGGGEGTLATVESESEQLFLENELKKAFPNPVGKDFWLGANDVTHEGTWVWIKKDEYVQEYTHWAPGEPSSRTSENCLALYDGLQYKWNDAPCNLPEGFICELPLERQIRAGDVYRMSDRFCKTRKFLLPHLRYTHFKMVGCYGILWNICGR
ncbi:perlucin-like isoform X3 [Ruditapes philippinarum]|uniref:perlucin-like isoform X3 n=1 Tax=Ruditapes philippinarum TaxID=129788 RepID=UPI00295B7D75|nr:perlucin-like isoform X3 [Ruditapes philippinarum]